ncbi:MAG: hypothetical protein ANABAC_2682 [Anaerolineae bacterium]|nr:MAG: hypothetical protein ANABAC_2682 [Anaerolineae bacterium]
MLIVLLVLTAIGGWLITQPRVLDLQPPPDATAVPGSAALRLSFSHPMQTESVHQRLQIDPLPAGDFHWEGKTLVFTPLKPWQSGATVHVRLSRGARTQTFPTRSLNHTVEWSFQIGYPKVIYLFPAEGEAALYQLDPLSGKVQVLSANGQEVLDYSLSASGAVIIFDVRQGNGSAIFRWQNSQTAGEPLLTFPAGQVRAAQLSPSGNYLAYELTDLREPNAKTHVWVTNYPPQGDQGIRLGAADQLTRSPLWSGQDILAYYDQTNRHYRFYDPRTQQEIGTIRGETGEKGAWSPDGETFLFAEILADGGQYPTSHLLAFHLPTLQLTDLTERNDVEDLGGVFSPQGDRLVFGRKFLDALHWTPGRQPWMLNLLQREAFPLLTEPHYNHYDFVWSPNGDQILFVRFNLMSLTDSPEIWIMNADGTQPRQLVKGGFAPQWMP